MTITEIILILIIAVFVLKPDDIKSITKTLKQIISYFSKLKSEIWHSIDSEEPKTPKNQEQLNNYLAKIIQISGKYEGEYDLPSIKAYYHKLLIEQNMNPGKK